MKRIIFALLLVLVLGTVNVGASIIAAKYTEQKCGNGVREGYELCEPGTAFDLCPSIGKILKIAMVCDYRNCACLPDRTAKDCGNGILEGVEMCDPGKKQEVDFCPNISNAINLPLKCDTATCDCVPEGKPVVISYCGDGKVEGEEDCESTEDCPKGRECNNCTCVRPPEDLNLTPVQYNVTTDEINVPTIEDITTSKSEKTTMFGFVIEDYIGEIIPDALEYFNDETINLHITTNAGTNVTVGIITTQMVVQEIHPYELNDTTMEIWTFEDTIAAIKNADDRTATILQLLKDGNIAYKPTSFWRRLWMLFFTPF